MMPIIYRGWYITAFRIGLRGEYAGDARDANEVRADITTLRISGKGAKRKVLASLVAKIDKLEGPIAGGTR